ncbi:hypothetical protein P3T73_12730 [Kiritimatiellota bacterium B12222]|nr:hypothetical protein P3T73_12730 [Kiritimatiellota bacterium B12222]
MNDLQQRDIIREIVKNDPRYREEAYSFVREGLDYTVHELKDLSKDESHHVRGWELSKGIRDYAIREYGPVCLRVLRYWGIQSSDDLGEIVYNMIDAQLLGKTDEDQKQDFHGVFDFETAFRDPFLPSSAREDSVE